MLKGLAAAGLMPWLPRALYAAGAPGASTLDFASLPNRIGEGHAVAAGYGVAVLVRWGDPVLTGAPPFEPARGDAAAQARQFGFNNDYVAFLPLPRGSARSDHGLLCVNHEYGAAPLMFPGVRDARACSAAQVACEQAALGHSVLEVHRTDEGWRVVRPSRWSRRITAGNTAIRLSGPAAGHPRLRTTADPAGREVRGTMNNCAGGCTPWGTVLIAEENVDDFFEGPVADDHPEHANQARLGVGTSKYAWFRHDLRFDARREPNECNRYGWIVEYDPYDPDSVPVKRTAMGRFKHEGASTVVSADGRLVVYSGDDERFEYLYRFVSRDPVQGTDPAANRDLLDHGVLSVARFDADGTLRWLPLVWGEEPLTAGNGFAGPADVMIETRRAADLLGATPLDRPEDVEPNPVTGRVYVALTNNSKREDGDAVNPRAPNPYGHILELQPPSRAGAPDHAAEVFRWDILLKAGPPGDAASAGRYGPAAEPGTWFAAPDNLAFDPAGRLWVATDQGGAQAANGIPDGVRGMDLDGPGRAAPRLLFACPRGAEMCGPAFTPDGTTLFLAVQHPGEEAGSTFDTPSTRWPDFDPTLPPRSAVVAVTRLRGGPIGGSR